MAKKKGVSSTTNGRDSRPKYLGIKCSDGTKVRSGNIIVTQRGSKYNPGSGAYMGNTFTVHAKKDGSVKFINRRNKLFIEVV
jgi:large subunit ribosomal protein L27